MSLRAPRVIVAILVVVVAAGSICVFSPAARILVQRATQTSVAILLRRDNRCGVIESVQGMFVGYRRWAARREISSKLRLLEGGRPGLTRWATPRGEFWTPRGFGLANSLVKLETGVYSTGLVSVRPGDVVLDCGAGVGAFTHEALDAGATKVIAIEPAGDNLESLRRNFRPQLESGRVVVYGGGVWSRDTFLTLRVAKDQQSNSMVLPNKSYERETLVSVTTIDRLAGSLGLPRVDFIKMDIEGSERHALEGASAVLQRWRPRMAVAAYHLPDDLSVIADIALRQVPTYRIQAGCCLLAQGHVRPEMLYFY